MNISEIISLAPESWINDFTGIPQGLTPIKGGTFYVGKIADPKFPTVQIDAAFFRKDAAQFDGGVCSFSGQGMKRTEYNGTPKVTIGEKAQIKYLGAPQEAVSSPTSTNTPVNGQNAPQRPSPPPNGQPAVLGMTVGMALNNAIRLIQARGQEEDVSLSEEIYNLASDIIRLSRVLEEGKLAPKEKDRPSQGRKEPEPPSQPPAQPPTPTPQPARSQAEQDAQDEQTFAGVDAPF